MTRVDTGNEAYSPTFRYNEGTDVKAQPAPFTTLKQALLWVDRNGASDAEYLIRLDADTAQIPKIVLQSWGTINMRSKIRLRGMGDKEHVITHDGSNDLYYSISALGYYNGIIGIFGAANEGITEQTVSCLTFQLEKGITLKGSVDHVATAYNNLVDLNGLSSFVMKKGSKLTGHCVSDSSDSTYSVIASYITDSAADSFYKIFIDSGAKIVGNTLPNGNNVGSGTNANFAKAIWSQGVAANNKYPFVYISKDADISDNGHNGDPVVLVGIYDGNYKQYEISSDSGTDYTIPSPSEF
jgi:hypothetical protein